MTLLRLAFVGCVRSSSGMWAWHSRGLVSKWYLPKSVSLCLPFTPTAKRETSKNTLETLISKTVQELSHPVWTQKVYLFRPDQNWNRDGYGNCQGAVR